jgi:hypothetical protein
MDGKSWGQPYNWTPDRDTFGGHEPERRSSQGTRSNPAGAWRTLVTGATIAAGLAFVLLAGRSSMAAPRPSDIGRIQPQLRTAAIAAGPAFALDFTYRVLDTNGPENRGR